MSQLSLVGKRSLAEVARQLDVHVATVWRWATRGVRGRRLTTIVIGGRRYVLNADLDAFLRPPSVTPDQRAVPADQDHDAVESQLDRLGL
jgi:hypothetical protein